MAKSRAWKPAASARDEIQLELGCLDGVRVLASTWVLLAHCWTLWSAQLPFATRRQLTNDYSLPWLAMQGGFGADIFLVLSSLLATYHLLPALEGSATSSELGAAPSGAAKPRRSGGGWFQTVLAYWRRRARRILPAYVAINLLALALFRHKPAQLPLLAQQARDFAFSTCPDALWANAAFLTNTLTVKEGCGAHLWSTAVMVHFYLAWPLLLCTLRPTRPGFRARIAIALGLAVPAGAAWRFWSAFRASFYLPLGDLTVPEEEANLNRLLKAVYLPTPSRVAELAIGAALGLLLRSPGALSWAARRPLLVSSTAFAVQAMYLLTVSNGNMFPLPLPRLSWAATRATAAMLFYGSPFYAFLIASTLLALILRSDPLHAAVAQLLSTRAFKAAATLTYSFYLLHEFVKYGLVLAASDLLLALIAQAPVAALAALVGAVMAASYAVAWCSWLLIERRF